MIKLLKTCDACPEQYDAFFGGDRVGYLRLRHGNFTVECPDVGGRLVYEACPYGDGVFEDEERDYYLRFAVKAIEDWIAEGKPKKDSNQSVPPAPNVNYEIVEE